MTSISFSWTVWSRPWTQWTSVLWSASATRWTNIGIKRMSIKMQAQHAKNPPGNRWVLGVLETYTCHKIDEKAHYFPVVGYSNFYRRRTRTRCTLTASGVKERADNAVFRPKENSFLSFRPQQEDSNPRPANFRSAALPLSYAVISLRPKFRLPYDRVTVIDCAIPASAAQSMTKLFYATAQGVKKDRVYRKRTIRRSSVLVQTSEHMSRLQASGSPHWKSKKKWGRRIRPRASVVICSVLQKVSIPFAILYFITLSRHKSNIFNLSHIFLCREAFPSHLNCAF